MTAAAPGPSLSVVVVAYEMRRELPRTIRSLSPAMQRDVDAGDYELVVVDNGSSRPPDRAACEAFGARLRWLRIEGASPSPAAAVNRGLAEARAPLVGVIVDGARIASPGLLRHASAAARLHPRPVISPLAFQLGPDLQRRALATGYDREAEDALLARCGWTEDGYRLFELSVPGGSSRHGWFEPPAESSALFMPAALWAELGGADERFASPGGGFMSLDLFERACALAGTQVIMLLGEATFHQTHGGAATTGTDADHRRFAAEYARLRGREYARPRGRPLVLGSPSPQAVATIAALLPHT